MLIAFALLIKGKSHKDRTIFRTLEIGTIVPFYAATLTCGPFTQSFLHPRSCAGQPRVTERGQVLGATGNHSQDKDHQKPWHIL